MNLYRRWLSHTLLCLPWLGAIGFNITEWQAFTAALFIVLYSEGFYLNRSNVGSFKDAMVVKRKIDDTFCVNFRVSLFTVEFVLFQNYLYCKHFGNFYWCKDYISKKSTISTLKYLGAMPEQTEGYSRGYKTFFVLNSTEHEISTAHKN